MVFLALAGHVEENTPMKLNRLSLLSIALATTPALAFAAADVSVTLSQTATVDVYTTSRFNVVVKNVGNQTASGVAVSIQLPVTHTSPQVYVMGALGARSANCTPVGTKLNCTIGTLKRNITSTVFYEIMLPQNAGPLVMTATATPTDSKPTNNTASITAALLNPNVPVVAPRTARVRHCTGQGLTSFFECTLFPSSLSWHEIQLNGDNTVTFLNSDQGAPPPDAGGTWIQNAANRLELHYTDSSGPAADFDGYGVSAGSCFEGRTTFPGGGAYVSLYEVCLQ